MLNQVLISYNVKLNKRIKVLKRQGEKDMNQTVTKTTQLNLQKPRVAFICVHNSCRSQIAEALGKALASEVFESYSAGTELRPQINQDAVRIIKKLHNIDMNETQRSKLLADIPEVDVVITMGCNVQCPNLPCKHREDWGLEDPSGKEDAAFIETAEKIKEKVLELKVRIEAGLI